MTTTNAMYDQLTLEIGRADSLTGLLANRLEALANGDGPNELYALSIVALGVSDRLQRILDAARALHAEDRAKTGKKGA